MRVLALPRVGRAAVAQLSSGRRLRTSGPASGVPRTPGGSSGSRGEGLPARDRARGIYTQMLGTEGVKQASVRELPKPGPECITAFLRDQRRTRGASPPILRPIPHERNSIPALTSAVLFVVQACPFAPARALKGNSPTAVHRTPSALSAGPNCEVRVGMVALPSSTPKHGGPRSRLLKGREPCRRCRQNGGPDREVL
jgi:hypothetical protein